MRGRTGARSLRAVESGFREGRPDENACSHAIVGAAIEVHRRIGPGLLESAYEIALAHELRLRNVRFVRQLPLHVNYKGIDLGQAYRIDLIVERLVIVEVKALTEVSRIHEVQLMTYLRLARKRLGLILNFHELRMRDGVRRVVNGLP